MPMAGTCIARPAVVRAGNPAPMVEFVLEGAAWVELLLWSFQHAALLPTCLFHSHWLFGSLLAPSDTCFAITSQLL